MDSSTPSFRPRQKLTEEEVTQLRTAKRRRKIIFFFVFLFISVALIVATATSVKYITRAHFLRPQVLLFFHYNRAVDSFCSVSNDTNYYDQCLESMNDIIVDRFFDTDPIRIFKLSIEKVALELKLLDRLLFDKIESPFRNCSSSVVDSLSQLNVTFVERQRPDWRSVMTGRISAVETNLRSCTDGLGKIESNAAAEIVDQMHVLEVYLRSSRYFLLNYEEVFRKFDDDVSSVDSENRFVVNSENVYDIVMAVAPFVFMFCMFWALFRYH